MQTNKEHVTDEKRTKASKPLVVRALTTLLAIWIALGASQFIAGHTLDDGASSSNSNAHSEQATERSNDASDRDATPDETPGAGGTDAGNPAGATPTTPSDVADNFAVPAYNGKPATQVNDNAPAFDSTLLATARAGAFEDYWPLDSLGRATGAVVCAGPETAPEGERDSIGDIRPTGFHLTRYDWVDGKYLYNRCHLVGWQLTGENSNMRNLITGTRYMNVEGMLPYEEKVDSYIEATGNHVLYRATPIYEGSDLVARGVLLEARSVEDDGRGLSFCVFCFNVQPGVSITYATGASAADGTMREQDLVDETQFDYILNTNSKKIHYPNCPSVDDMKEKNKRGFNGTVEEAKAQGYSPCGRCKP